MITFLQGLAFWDAVLVVVATLGTIAALLYVISAYWMATGTSRKQRIVRATVKLCDKLDNINKDFEDFFNDDEEYNPTWMDYKRWKESRL